MIKFIHIGDIHAGKSLQNKSRNDDAEYAISQVIDFAKKEQVDFIIIAGDIFDQYNPDTQAIKIIFDYMAKELNALNIPVIMITGNHDSQAFFEGYKTLAKYANIHIFTKPSSEDFYITIKDTTIVGIPFVSPKFIKEGGSTSEYASALEDYINTIISKAPKSKFNILTTHLMVSGSKPANSERVASISNFYAVNLNNINALKDLDYIGLGHVHRHQKVPTHTQCYYTGSCFQIDFNEEGHNKYFNFVVLEEMSLPRVELISLSVKNQLKTFYINTKDLKLQEIDSLKGYARVIIDDTIENIKLLEEKLKSENLFNKIVEIRRKTYENPNLEIDIHTIRDQLVDFYEIYFKEKFKQDIPQELKETFLELQYEVEHQENS